MQPAASARVCLSSRHMFSTCMGSSLPGRRMMRLGTEWAAKGRDARRLKGAVRHCAGRQGEEGAGAGLHRAVGHLHACAGAPHIHLCAQSCLPPIPSLRAPAMACVCELLGWACGFWSSALHCKGP